MKDRSLKTVEQIAAMPVGFPAVIEAAMLFYGKREIVMTQAWLKLTLGPLGRYIMELSDHQLTRLHAIVQARKERL